MRTPRFVIALGAAMEREKPIEVRFDRPFLFAIQHRGSGLCLFLGRITTPEGSANPR